MGTLKFIRIYPVKSLDPVICQQAQVLPEGALLSDRQYALMSHDKKSINGKRDNRVHTIHSIFHLQNVSRLSWDCVVGPSPGLTSRSNRVTWKNS